MSTRHFARDLCHVNVVAQADGVMAVTLQWALLCITECSAQPIALSKRSPIVTFLMRFDC